MDRSNNIINRSVFKYCSFGMCLQEEWVRVWIWDNVKFDGVICTGSTGASFVFHISRIHDARRNI